MRDLFERRDEITNLIKEMVIMYLEKNNKKEEAKSFSKRKYAGEILLPEFPNRNAWSFKLNADDSLSVFTIEYGHETREDIFYDEKELRITNKEIEELE